MSKLLLILISLFGSSFYDISIDNHIVYFTGFTQLKWINKNNILIVENSYAYRSRIIEYNIKEKKFRTVYNGDLSKGEICNFGGNGKIIGTYDVNEDTLQIYRKSKLVYSKPHFTSFAMNNPSFKCSKSAISKDILFITEKRIIINFSTNTPGRKAICLVDIDYTEDKILNKIKFGKDTFFPLRMPRVYENKPTIIGISGSDKNDCYLYYYDLDNISIKKISFKKNKSLVVDDIRKIDNRIYFTAFIPSPEGRKYALYSIDPPYKEMKKIMDNVLQVQVSNKYLLALKGAPIKVARVDSFSYILYDLKDLKKIANLSNGHYKFYTNYIMLISPFDNRIAIVDCTEKKFYIVEIR